MPAPKIPYSLIVAERYEQGSYWSAYFELNGSGNDTILAERVKNESTLDIVRHGFTDIVKRVFVNSYQTVRFLLPDLPFGFAPVLLIIGTIGALFLSLKDKFGLYVQISLLITFLLQLAPYSVLVFLPRPLMTLVPITCVLICAQARPWLYFLCGGRELVVKYSVMAIGIVSIMLAIWITLDKYESHRTYLASFKPTLDIAKWIEGNSDPDDIVMSRNPGFAYYAKRRQVILPCGETSAVHRYAVQKNASIVIVHRPKQRGLHDDPLDMIAKDRRVGNTQSSLGLLDYFELLKRFDNPDRTFLLLRPKRSVEAPTNQPDAHLIDSSGRREKSLSCGKH
ncbi:MAG: hypothetical protein V3R68_07815 [Gammaproteobacteria bacterium]